MWRFLHGFPIAPGLVLLGFLFVGSFAPLISPHDPTLANLSKSLVPPVFAGGEWSYPLGTDNLGRDVLSRLFGGARIDLLVAIAVVIISGGVGVFIGIFAGYRGGWWDSVLMRLTDAALAFPFLLLAIVIVGVFHPGIDKVVITLSLAGWAPYARVIRSEVLRLKNEAFVTMASVMGGGFWWIMWRHLIPNVLGSLVVLATLQIGAAVVAEGSLSFLGIGVPPPTPTWGGMLSDGRNYLTVAWWLPTLPGLALTLVVVSSNWIGDWLRTQYDPTGRR